MATSQIGSVEATAEQRVELQRKRLSRVGNDIKSINEQGRLSGNDPSQLNLFKGMFRTLQPSYEQFLAIWDNLMELHLVHTLAGAFPTQSDTTIYSNVKRYYYEANAKYECICASPSLAETANASQNVTHVVAPFRAHLPKVSLPEFHGQLTGWPFFRDTFISLVHDEPRLSKIEKYHFLIGSLRSQARAVIKNIPLEENSYEQAWQAVVTAYDNKRELASTYLNQILSYKTIQGKPTVATLKHFLTTISGSVSAFKRLEIPKPIEFLLFELALRCLDSQTREAFEIEHTTVDFPEVDQLIKFVEMRCKALARLGDVKQDSEKTKLIPHPPNRFQPRPVRSKPAVLFSKGSIMSSNSSHVTSVPGVNQQLLCVVCSKSHRLSDCPTYKTASPKERLHILNKLNVCKNCLCPHHKTSQCTSKWNCRICHSRHHTTLHLPTSVHNANVSCSSSPDSSALPTTSGKVLPPAPVTLSGTYQDKNGALLGTAEASIKSSSGIYKTIRLIIDCGSQYSVITQACASALGLQVTENTGRISGLGETAVSKTEGQVTCIIKPLSGKYEELVSEAIVVSSITSFLPQRPLPPVVQESYQHFKLADPNFWKPGPIDFLLGADLYPKIILGRSIVVEPELPYVIDTIFGCIVMGSFEPSAGQNLDINSFLTISNESIAEIINKFWQVEEVRQPIPQSPEDIRCEEHFKTTHQRVPSGQYVVRLPFKDSPPLLGPSRQRALCRLFNLETKLSRSPYMSAKYHHFMKEYLELNHMVKATEPASYLIPHHAIFKASNDADEVKLRVVFDASAKTSKGSLNDHLSIGPKLQRDISDIMLNSRQYAVMFTADIVKMYRQILVHQQDWKYQHILWRFDKEQQVEEYALKTVTYGVASAPYLALRVMQQLVQDEGAPYPLASVALSRDVYVDDIVTGAKNISEALTLQSEIIQLLDKGGFKLSKWSSNHSDILMNAGDDANDSLVSLTAKEDYTVKILGIQWDPKHDVFSYHVQPPKLQCTKRAILSAIARIYDPLGYIAPVVFAAKYLLQMTWSAGIEWDETVPDTIAQPWVTFVNQLHELDNIQIPRRIPLDSKGAYHILGFSDASEKGFCAAIYLNVVGDIKSCCYLLKAKTKLAPLKTRSIPCLELCAALLLVQLYQSIANFVKHYPISQTYFFTDSMVVLGWLRTSPHLLKTFVANRVVQIINNCDVSYWHHISSEDNPADVGSRGIRPSELRDHTLWWRGPSWLSMPNNQWPLSRVIIPNDLPELKSISYALTNVRIRPDFLTWMERYSSYKTLVRVFAYIMRFCSKKSSSTRYFGPILAEEFEAANKMCIFLLQNFYYPRLENNGTSNLARSLNVFRGEDGLLRVGGRLRHSSLTYGARHAILLPKRCHFNSLLIDHYHRVNMHIGPSALQAIIFQKYWIPSARSLIRQRKLKCLTCFKLSRRPQPPYMGDIPAVRFSTNRPFYHTGVDFAGPFLCKESTTRKASITKAYLCLFICLSTKALHLELATSLSTEAFLDCFDRFVARRGLPNQMFSDCGTNFVGASNYLRDVSKWINDEEAQSRILKHTAPCGVSWKFNPPSTPHFGGIWEAGVKSAKSLLIRTISNHPYTREELSTIFVKIEGILNSRPITALSSDPGDLQPLTPGHFLIGGPINALPETDLRDIPDNRLSRWQHLRQQVQTIWERWRLEYLHTLHQRRKWTKPTTNLSVGDLVLLDDHNLTPLQWPLARVVSIHPGKDDVVRVVTVRTSTGVFKRPVTKIVALQPITRPTPDHFHAST